MQRVYEESGGAGVWIWPNFSLAPKREAVLQPELGRHECRDQYDWSAGRGLQETRHVDTVVSPAMGGCISVSGHTTSEWYVSLQHTRSVLVRITSCRSPDTMVTMFISQFI